MHRKKHLEKNPVANFFTVIVLLVAVSYTHLEYREAGEEKETAVIYNSISMQAFLLQYPFLCGMTGTAKSAEAEIRQMYGLSVDVIAPHLPCVRIDHEDRIFLKREEQVLSLIHIFAGGKRTGKYLDCDPGNCTEYINQLGPPALWDLAWCSVGGNGWPVDRNL